MTEEDIIEKIIREKQKTINQESSLKKHYNKLNILSFLTSLILLVGIIIGLVRIIMNLNF